jgi:nicotinamide mononucleotide transporter
MGIHDQLQLFWEQVKQADLVQWMAVALGIAEVLLAKANKIWLYPAGIAGTLLSIYILFHVGLFAESLLNGYYLVMSVYGWWHWVKKKNLPPVKASYCNSREWATVISIVALAFVLLYILLKKFTSSSVPAWDAWVSATAWAGMWLLARRKIENWVLLNISNGFAVPLLLYKRLPLYAGLTVFLFVIAILGYYEWAKIISSEKNMLIKS